MVTFCVGHLEVSKSNPQGNEQCVASKRQQVDTLALLSHDGTSTHAVKFQSRPWIAVVILRPVKQPMDNPWIIHWYL